MENELGDVQAVTKVLLEEYLSPSDEVVRYLARRVGLAVPAELIVDRFTPIVKEAFKQFIAGWILTVTPGAESGPGLRKADDEISDEEFEGYFVVNVVQ